MMLEAERQGRETEFMNYLENIYFCITIGTTFLQIISYIWKKIYITYMYDLQGNKTSTSLYSLPNIKRS